MQCGHCAGDGGRPVLTMCEITGTQQQRAKVLLFAHACHIPSSLGRAMRRREFIRLVVGSVVVWPLRVRAQASGKSYRIAYLTLAGDQDSLIVKQRLNELGYNEGRNLMFDYRSAEGHLERLPQLAAESVATNPDVIVTGFGTETARAAQAATATI